MWKKIGWFFAVTIAFNITIMAVFALLYFLFPEQVGNLLSNTRSNANLGSIVIYSGIIGFISAFFTLALSRWWAKTFMGVQLITDRNHHYGYVLDIVEQQAKAVGIKMPEVGFFEDPSINAFATGPSKNRSLIAFSTAALDESRFSRDALEAVSAHEVMHIVNGDMVVMTLIQGVVNTLVLTVSKVVANAVHKVSDSEILYHITYIVGQIVFGILALPITAYFSRQREFGADSGAAQLVGVQKMVQALRELEEDTENRQYSSINGNSGKQAMCIAGLESKFSIFDTHPPMADRINALQNMS